MGLGFTDTGVLPSAATPVASGRRGAALHISGPGVAFGGLTVLDGIEVTIRPGTFLTLLGSSAWARARFRCRSRAS